MEHSRTWFNILPLYIIRTYVLNADETSPHNVPVVVAAKSCPQYHNKVLTIPINIYMC